MVVTGCAGFVGSQLAERLLDTGHEVVGIDCFTPHYPRALKDANLRRLRDEPAFALHDLDLASDRLDAAVEGAERVFHIAGEAGVRDSFGPTRRRYVRNNVRATRRLLEAAERSRPERVVYASSSSVYGNARVHPTPESAARRPLSPYAMTKAAVEDLASEFHERAGIPAVGLRLFTLYGPRQRPDMAFHRFIAAALSGEPVAVNGDGRQARDFTFAPDAVELALAAGERGRPGGIYNVGRGRPVRLTTAVATIERLAGRRIDVERVPAARGDAEVTAADTALAARELGAAPTTSLENGLAAQLAWMLDHEPTRLARTGRAGRRVP